jgi:hypothetical protein
VCWNFLEGVSWREYLLEGSGAWDLMEEGSQLQSSFWHLQDPCPPPIDNTSASWAKPRKKVQKRDFLPLPAPDCDDRIMTVPGGVCHYFPGFDALGKSEFGGQKMTTTQEKEPAGPPRPNPPGFPPHAWGPVGVTDYVSTNSSGYGRVPRCVKE